MLHPSQAAATLGLPFAAEDEALVAASELASLLDRWIELVRPLPWPLLHEEPVNARGQTLFYQAVRTFVPIRYLPRVLTDETVRWDTARLAEGEARTSDAIGSTQELVAFLGEIAAGWMRFVVDGEATIREHGRTVVPTFKGAVPYAILIGTARDRARYKLRQAERFLTR